MDKNTEYPAGQKVLGHASCGFRQPLSSPTSQWDVQGAAHWPSRHYNRQVPGPARHNWFRFLASLKTSVAKQASNALGRRLDRKQCPASRYHSRRSGDGSERRPLGGIVIALVYTGPMGPFPKTTLRLATIDVTPNSHKLVIRADRKCNKLEPVTNSLLKRACRGRIVCIDHEK